MPGWVWVLLCVLVLLPVGYFVISMMNKLRRLTNPEDIISSIEDWFTNGDEFGDVPEMNTPYYFAGVDKSLNLKRGSTKKYLPEIAQKHGYVFRMAG